MTKLNSANWFAGSRQLRNQQARRNERTAGSQAGDVRKQADELRQLVGRSLAAAQTAAADCQVAEIEQAYLEFPRRHVVGVEHNDLLSLKYLLSNWRRVVGSALVSRATAGDAERFAAAVRQLGSLDRVLSGEDVQRLVAAFHRFSNVNTAAQNEVVQLLVKHGDIDSVREPLVDIGLPAAQQRLGPSQFRRRIKPYAMARFKQPDHWLSEPGVELQHYPHQDDDTITWRGARLQTGDVILADLALPHEGLLNSCLKPRALFTHCGLFLVLRYQDRLIPAVLEIHERGARVVPANRFLSPTHIYYSEAFRMVEEAPPEWCENLSNEVLRLAFEEQISYDFLARPVEDIADLPDGRRGATCFTLIELMFLRTGVYQPLVSRTQVAQSVIENTLSVLDMGDISREMSHATDFVRSATRLVGVFDNDALVQNLSREVAIGHCESPAGLAFQLGTRRLRPSRVQDFDWWYSHLIAASQQENLAGSLLRAAAHQSLATIPNSGAPAAIAFYLSANRRLGPLVEEFARSERFLTLLDAASGEPLGTLEGDRGILDQAAQLRRKHGIEDWFEPAV